MKSINRLFAIFRGNGRINIGKEQPEVKCVRTLSADQVSSISLLPKCVLLFFINGGRQRAV